MQATKNSPLVVIVGETASGKSQLALQIAQRFDGEIICADSWTVRREVTIGTAKPSNADQALVPHHLIDIVGPDEDFTAAVFKSLAVAAIDDISKRGKLPIMVGGTGLYIDSVLYNYGFLNEGERSERYMFDVLSIDDLLSKIDQAGIKLGNVDIRNKRRLIRLLETNGATASSQPLRPNTHIIGLRTDKETLSAKIAHRTATMLATGLEQEVRTLAERYGWDCEGLKGIGYAQWRDYFLGSQSLDETTQKINKATRDLAKRQRTWFKRNSSIHWVSTPVNWQHLISELTTFLYS